MMSKIKPNAVFEYIRPDEIAECWDGVTDDLYTALWNVTPEKASYAGNIEDMGPGDVVGIDCLDDVWDKFTEAQQIALNDLADKKAAQDAKEMAEWRKNKEAK